MATHSPHQWLGAECVGTAMLLATVMALASWETA